MTTFGTSSDVKYEGIVLYSVGYGPSVNQISLYQPKQNHYRYFRMYRKEYKNEHTREVHVTESSIESGLEERDHLRNGAIVIHSRPFVLVVSFRAVMKSKSYPQGVGVGEDEAQRGKSKK